MSLLAQLDSSSLRAQEAKPLNRFPRMVHSFMVAQARQSEKHKLRTLKSLRTKADAEAAELRSRTLRALSRDALGESGAQLTSAFFVVTNRVEIK